MKKYSPYIKKYIKEINDAGYAINDNNRSQISKCCGCYEVLITDLTVRSLFTKITTVLVWIKNKKTRTIEVEKMYKHEIMPLPFRKINAFAEKTIAELDASKVRKLEESMQSVTRDIHVPVTEIKIREVPVGDMTF